VEEIEGTRTDEKDITCSLITRISITKLTTLIKVTYRFNTVSIKITMSLIIETNKKNPQIPKYLCNHKSRPMGKALRKKKKSEDTGLLAFKVQYMQQAQ
jgi:uncharacterized protein (DUF736 family)